jgi:metal-responsive CopG/Arc/MetJ family transcriptional regulator
MVSLTISMSQALYLKVAKKSEDNGDKSISATIQKILEEKLAQDEKIKEEGES